MAGFVSFSPSCWIGFYSWLHLFRFWNDQINIKPLSCVWVCAWVHSVMCIAIITHTCTQARTRAHTHTLLLATAVTSLWRNWILEGWRWLGIHYSSNLVRYAKFIPTGRDQVIVSAFSIEMCIIWPTPCLSLSTILFFQRFHGHLFMVRRGSQPW